MGQTWQVNERALEVLRDYLILALPAELVALDLLRAATVKTGAGPFNVPANAVLQIGEADPTALTNVPLTAGAARTAAQVAADINAVFAGLAATDVQGRVVVTSLTPPNRAAQTPSLLLVGADATGANAALGWSPSGLSDKRLWLVPPTVNGFFLYDPPQGSYQFGADNAPMLLVKSFRTKPNPKGVKSFETDVTTVLEVAHPADRDQLAERSRAWARAIYEVIANDRHLSTLGLTNEVVYSNILGTDVKTSVYNFRNGQTTIPVGLVDLTIFMRWVDPN